MSSLDYIKWTQRQKQQRWGELRKILEAPWSGDRGWEGRTIGLHLPLELRNFAISVQEKLGLRSMKEVLFKALIIGLKELDTLPRTTPAPPRFPPLREALPPAPAPVEPELPTDDDEEAADEAE